MTSLRALLVAVGIVALLLPATPAVADSASFADAADDLSQLAYVDLKAVKVKHTKKSIKITYTSRSLGNLNGSEAVLIDTKPGRKGPELQVGFARYSEGWVTAMRAWKIDRSEAAKRKWSVDPMTVGTCDRTVRINSRWEREFTPVTITIRKKKGCITAKKVRVQVSTVTNGYSDHVTWDQWNRNVRDRLPNGKRAFTGWVKQRGAKAKARRFVDGRDPVRWWNDIRRVSVDFRSTLSVSVSHLVKPAGRTGDVRLYLDTDGDRKPDYEASRVGGSVALRSMSDWGVYTGAVACGSLVGAAYPASHGFSLSSTCIGEPAVVRVAVQTTDRAPAGPQATDWLGGARAWSAPIARPV